MTTSKAYTNTYFGVVRYIGRVHFNDNHNIKEKIVIKYQQFISINEKLK